MRERWWEEGGGFDLMREVGALHVIEEIWRIGVQTAMRGKGNEEGKNE